MCAILLTYFNKRQKFVKSGLSRVFIIPVIIFYQFKAILNNYVFPLLQLNAQLILTGVNKHKDKVGIRVLYGSSCNRSNTRKRVSSNFRTPRCRLEK